MRRLERAGGARRTARSADAFHVQARQQRDAVAAFDGDSDGVGKALAARTSKSNTFKRVAEFNQTVGQWRKSFRWKYRSPHKPLHGSGQADDAGDVFSAGAAFVFMTAAENDGIGMKRR